MEPAPRTPSPIPVDNKSPTPFQDSSSTGGLVIKVRSGPERSVTDDNGDYIFSEGEVIAKRYEVKKSAPIGRGAFGVVVEAWDLTQKRSVAVKIINAQAKFTKPAEAEIGFLRRMRKQEDFEESHVVEWIDHFKWGGHICIVFERLSVSLYDLLSMSQHRGLSLNLVRKFAKQLVASLAFIRKPGVDIIHCDLKPENVLIDACGYIKLIDFGCAVKLRGIVFTLIGTPHYMAPEVIMGDGYGLSCDVWSLGVCLHEFLYGPVPFGNSTQDPHPIFIETLTANLIFPPHVDPPSVAIVKGLLQRRVERRLGCSGCSSVNWEAVKTHPFFYDFSFEKLWSKSLEAPYVPKTETFVGDTSLDELSDSALSSDHSDDRDRPEEDCDDDGWDKVF